VALILRRHRRSTFRYEEEGTLVAVFVDDDGNKWFELESVVRFAARLALEGRSATANASSGRQKSAPPAPVASRLQPGDYDPSPVRSRAKTLGETPPPADKAPPLAAQQRSSPKGNEKPLPPSVQGATAVRPTTAIDPTWFDDDFPAFKATGGAGRGGSK
jgi:hypothetical protein